jgi:hypothetical protein
MDDDEASIPATVADDVYDEEADELEANLCTYHNHSRING